MTNLPLLHLDSLCKSYGGVHALQNVSFSIDTGEVHALCGENGAGKSTLIKILTGVIRPDHGTVTLSGNPLPPGDVQFAERSGIAVIHQESTAFPDLNAIDNIFVGREIRHPIWGLDYRTMRSKSAEILHGLGETFPLDLPVRELSLAQRQMVSLARALIGNCKLLIMDEPTASLSAREADSLFKLIRRLRNDGVSVLYVSHRLEEIFSLADRITVLRDGCWVATSPVATITRDGLIEQMVGRVLAQTTLAERTGDPISPVPTVLQVRGITRLGAFRDVNFELHAGEILGLGGLVGAGRSEVARAIFGIDDYEHGEVVVHGRRLPKRSIHASLKSGLALVPEDRQHEGLVLPLSIRSNVSLTILRGLRRFGCIPFRREKQLVGQQLSNLQVKSKGMNWAASSLSGGNQQKLVLGKWLATDPKILILDEPTRGIDVGAKAQFHELIRQFAERGMAVVLISSELPELLALSDRILVMREGDVVGQLSRSEATQAKVLKLALPDSERSNERMLDV